jgi:competence protein ComEA
VQIRERLDSLSRGELAGLIVVVVLLLAGVAFWYSRSLPRPIEVATTEVSRAPLPTSAPSPPVSGVALASAAVPPSSSETAAVLIVDVTGAVRRPGVFEFRAGDRVIDAVERAGGALDRADLTLLNLAAPLTDGQQILVPKRGAAVSAAPPIGTGTGTTSTAGATVNINSADEATLETLNGVGPVLAAAIIQYRTEHGPFASVDQLDEVSGIGPATLEDLRSQVTV